ncbi:hypothetical protein [Streptomyces sp. NPDC058466]|uniref:hypothetical protein n=1 Tax=Streptomyces sp. NPDC058466 TaxID=3346512 RepID=UPI003663ABFE
MQLSRMRHPISLTHLNIQMQSSLDLTTLQRHRKLTQLVLLDCMVSSDLTPLRELPHLTRLFLWGCRGPIDLAPLADLDNLVIHMNDSTDAVGREHLPPERLNLSE